MKAKDLERELLDDQGQHGQQECLADALHAGLHLRLADLIDAGDAIHALDAVEVAPVDGVDAHEPRVPIGPWSLANADRVAHWAGLGKAHASGLVVRALAQVVQVRDRQPGQAFIARVAIDAVGALQELRDGPTAHILMGPIHRHQQLDIERGVLARKGCRGGAVSLEQRMLRDAVASPARNKAIELGPAVA